MTLLALNLTVTGAVLVGLGVLHIALPTVLGWHGQLAAASPLNREISYVHCFFIGLACVLWGLLPLTAGGRLLQPGPVTRLASASRSHGASRFPACAVATRPRRPRGGRTRQAAAEPAGRPAASR